MKTLVSGAAAHSPCKQGKTRDQSGCLSKRPQYLDTSLGRSAQIPEKLSSPGVVDVLATAIKALHAKNFFACCVWVVLCIGADDSTQRYKPEFRKVHIALKMCLDSKGADPQLGSLW